MVSAPIVNFYEHYADSKSASNPVDSKLTKRIKKYKNWPVELLFYPAGR